MTTRLCALAALCFCAGCASEAQTPLLPGENYSRKDALTGVEKGNPVVLAVLRFEADTGLWPHDLSELVPDYLTAEDIVPWRYHTFHHDDFALVYLGPLNGGTLHYDRDPGKDGAWNVWWNEGERRHIDNLDVERPPAPAASPPAQQAVRRLAALRKRVEAMPDRVVHREGLMKHHFDRGRFEDARTVCVGCIEKWPDYWWPYLILARINSRLGDTSDAERRLKALAERWDDFFGYAFLAQFYFDRKDAEPCKAALRRALRPAPTRHKEQYTYEQIGHRHSWVDNGYYHNAAYLAYRLGDRPLCLAVCDRWQEFVRDVQRYGGEEQRVLRVVCAANASDWDAAAGLLRAMREPPDYAAWQEDGIRALERVVKDRNARYEYDPKLFRQVGVPLTAEFDYK